MSTSDSVDEVCVAIDGLLNGNEPTQSEAAYNQNVTAVIASLQRCQLEVGNETAKGLYDESQNILRAAGQWLTLKTAMTTAELKEKSQVFPPVKPASTAATTGKPPSVSKLDHFAEGRAAAIQATLVLDRSVLPELDDVIGLENAKQALTEALIDPQLYPQWFDQTTPMGGGGGGGGGLKPWKVILMYGPPGTGKTHLAKAIAKRIHVGGFYHLSSTDLTSSWSGESEKLIRELFADARRRSSCGGGESGTATVPVVIFIDEIDSLCRQRNATETDANRRVKTELLIEIEALQRDGVRTYLLSATNCPWDLDTAFLRRFEKRIYVPLPDQHARVQMLKHFLKNTPLEDDVEWTSIGERTEGYSGDDLRCLAREIMYLPFRDYKRDLAEGQICNGGLRAASMTDVQVALASVPPTVSVEQLARYVAFTQRYGLSG